MASLTTTAASSPAALPAAASAAPATASSVSPTAAASKRPHLAGDDAPWHVAATGSAGIRPVPRIHHAPVLRVAQDDSSAYALAIMRPKDLCVKADVLKTPAEQRKISRIHASR